MRRLSYLMGQSEIFQHFLKRAEEEKRPAKKRRRKMDDDDAEEEEEDDDSDDAMDKKKAKGKNKISKRVRLWLCS